MKWEVCATEKRCSFLRCRIAESLRAKGPGRGRKRTDEGERRITEKGMLSDSETPGADGRGKRHSRGGFHQCYGQIELGHIRLIGALVLAYEE